MLLCIFSGTFVELSKVKQCGGSSRRRRPETSKLPSFPQQLGTAAILGRQIAREMDRLRSEKEERSQSRKFCQLGELRLLRDGHLVSCNNIQEVFDNPSDTYGII